MAGYSKEMLVDAFVSRYKGVPCSYDLLKMANDFYDKVGKDEFRKYCALDADAIKAYKLDLAKTP